MTKGEKLYYYFLNKYGSKEKEGIVLDDSGMSKLILEIFAMTDETFDNIVEDKN